jgi:hypothetical protein
LSREERGGPGDGVPREAARRDPAELATLSAEPGLCARCRYLRLLRGRHRTFVRCARAETDPRFPRYPRLPVIACEGFDDPRAGP